MVSEPTQYFFPSSPGMDQSIFKGSILVWPVVSLANVPQLAVDLIIHGSHLGPIHKVGILDPQDHIPVVGAVDHPDGLPQSQHTLNQITTPIQVYQTLDKRYTFVQQRAPVIKARKDAHVEKVQGWISAAGFGSVLVLVSVDAAARSDAHLQHPSAFFHYARPRQAEPPTALRRIIQAKYASFVPEDCPGVPYFCAGGLAARLLATLTSPAAAPVHVNTLVAYVAEGDNRLDAKAFAHEIVSLFDYIQSGREDGKVPTLSPETWPEPVSWKASDSCQNKTRQDIYG